MMVKNLTIFILYILSFPFLANGQTSVFSVVKSSFCSDKYDEYCPVYYNNGIVFCTNRIHSLFFDYSNSQNKGLFKISYIDTTGIVTWQKAKLFSDNLKTKYNDGPVSFNNRRDTIYYSRNQKIDGRMRENSNPRNTLGVFIAVLENKEWSKIKEFRFNNEYYSITTPCLSPDGKKLFFASDKPDGYGGSDIYYCQWKNDYWDNPVNLGPVINTKGNEAYPFINKEGELFFSSDGHPGLGGKDIFFSKLSGTSWLIPVKLDPPINSKDDDFGIITDSLMNSGYFSSNRGKSIDIYQFKTDFPPIFYIDLQRENQYCFRFSDSGKIRIDTLKLKYEWDFGDNQKALGAEVIHCFKGPGKFNVQLNLIDRATQNLFFSKLSFSLNLKEFEQPYINSPDVAVNGDLIEFDGSKSHLPGYEILNYLWDFDDGTRLQGESIQHAFTRKGDFNITLSLTLKSDLSGSISRTGVSKKIKVLADNKEKDLYMTESSFIKPRIPDVRKCENAIIENHFSAEEEAQKDVVFGVELLSSKTKIGLSNSIFKNLPKNYAIKEILDAHDSTYKYIADRQTNLTTVYPAYKDLISAGYRNTRVKIYELTVPAEKEFYSMLSTFNTLSDSFFDNYDRLTSNAYLMLDQIVKLMNKYPNIKLEIAFNTDISDYPDNSLRKAQSMANYLTNKGISSRRLVPKGFGNSRPLTQSRTEQERRLNRRVSFRIIDE